MFYINFKKINNNSGVTIVETLVASALFILVSTSFLSVFLMSSTSCKSTDYMYTAINLAKARLERLKGLDYNSLPQAVESNTRLDKDGDPDAYGDFYRTTQVNNVYGTDLTEITVSIT